MCNTYKAIYKLSKLKYPDRRTDEWTFVPLELLSQLKINIKNFLGVCNDDRIYYNGSDFFNHVLCVHNYSEVKTGAK